VSDVAESIVALLESGPTSIERFASTLEPDWIVSALEETGTASMRRRKLPAESAVWLVIGVGLFADRSITSVVEHLELVLPGVSSLARSAVTQARYRLGSPPIAHLFGQTAAAWADDGEQRYKGLGLFAVDCVCLRLQDTDENFEHFGKPGGRGGRNDAGYPQARGACLLNVSSRMLLDAEFGPFGRSEHELAEALWKSVPDQSLTLLDRGFVNYETFAQLTQHGEERHFLVRMRRDLKFTPLEELADGSLLVELRPSKGLRSSAPDVPERIRGRVVAYQHPDGEPSRVFTTLLDHERFPASELVALYHDRWEIELAYDEVKTHMLERKECLRSKLPGGVYQEIWGILLAYNLVRREMALAAEKEQVAPNRISFRLALLEVRNLLLLAAMTSSPGSLPGHIKDLPRKLTSLVLPARRSARRYPRHVKIKMSNYRRNRGKRGLDVDGEALK
jgi:hypothetical protein